LIGREGEIARVRGALGEARLVTLVGAGGCGKTRLAVAVAAGLAGEYPGGIWLADLAPLAEGALVAGAVAQAVGVRERSGEPVLETLVGALRAGRRLLVLDNCEHLIEDAAALAATLLARCPELRVLATSRAALRAGGELVWRVPSLPVPEGEGLAAARESAAIRLFVERARYAQPGFALTAATVGAVTAICRRLDGIPLAIELAAARVGHLGVGQIADRLDDALRLLTGGGRTAPPRHRTLAATLDWSFALLTDAERRLLEEVAVFAGGFTLAAAEAVDGGAWGVDARRATSDAPGAAETLDTLAALVEQSLVQVWQGEGEPRYRLLETVRQFALARLVGRGGEAAARDRHAAYYRALVAEAERELVGPRQVWWLVELERELDNLRAALAWYRQGGRAEEGARLVTGLHRFWISQAHYREGRDWLAGLLREHGDRLPTPLRGRALSQLGGVNWLLGDLDAAVAQVGEALGIFRATGDRAGQGDAALRLGEIERYAGRAGVAEGYLAGALEAYRAVGDERSAAMARNSLANLLIDRGDFAAATAHYAEVVAIGRALGDAILLSMPLLNLGFVWMMRGDHARAREFLRESVATCERIRDWRTLHFNLIALALLANAEGRPADAARLLGATAAVSALTGVPLQHAERDYHDRAVAAAREALGVAGYDAACAEGRGWSVAEAIGRALAQCAGG
jgi:non-specific serine/threonine protein kinase